MFEKLFRIVSFCFEFIKSIFINKPNREMLEKISKKETYSPNEQQLRDEIVDENEEVIESALVQQEEIEEEVSPEEEIQESSIKTLEEAKVRFDLSLHDVKEDEDYEEALEIHHSLVEKDGVKQVLIDFIDAIPRSKRKYKETSDLLIPYREEGHLLRDQLPLLLKEVVYYYEKRGVSVEAVYKLPLPGFKILEA